MTTSILNRNGYRLFPRFESSSFIHRSHSRTLQTIPKCHRLESRIISQSSNYYASCPRESFPSLIIQQKQHQIHYPYQFKPYDNTSEYCDLFNLLESDVELKLLTNTTSIPSDYWQYHQPLSRRIKRHTKQQQHQSQYGNTARKHSHNYKQRNIGNRRRSVDFEYAHARLNRDKFVHENHRVLLAECCTSNGAIGIEHRALLPNKKSRVKIAVSDERKIKNQIRQSSFWRLALNYFCIPVGGR
ncbi:unnamed protein product [Didymodactylos carnosus]|uniref:Uncharacterized protein n=1 Tax=Didymodactylos carnosus TaxID=1234261 RepID=A0A813R474_9BILA|nr:unnamed protein product [Didymodactylos carnosus]CAF0820517.1 unnamed protein product [Didymodactylos carnosus]CAF3558944.1 unnamed protein product [Didymodactylos carnosus]CAF3604793.1 unnamed protein product [Didymodactylos carnosus]